jgi:alcohol dehydrogenase class IV
MQANLRALRQREPRNDALRRYEEVARLVTGQAAATADDGVAWVRQLVSDLRIPPLGSYGLAAADMAEVIEKGSKAGSMKANPIILTVEEQREILAGAL